MDIKRSTFGCQGHWYSFGSVVNMFKINLLFALTLCCTVVGIQCDLTGGCDCRAIMTKLKLLVGEETVKRSCAEVPYSGIYTIQPEKPFKEPMSVLCDQEYDRGGWIVIQHRFDGSINFYRSWQEYKNGFGNLEGEFWLGLDRIHQLTVSRPHELAILLEDFEGKKAFARYNLFEIGDENEKYELKKLGAHFGTFNDSLVNQNGMKFTTFDSDNDVWSSGNCAVKGSGAWWYRSCHSSNLNGKYLRGVTEEFATGMIWFYFRGDYYSLKVSKMMIRPINA